MQPVEQIRVTFLVAIGEQSEIPGPDPDGFDQLRPERHGRLVDDTAVGKNDGFAVHFQERLAFAVAPDDMAQIVHGKLKHVCGCVPMGFPIDCDLEVLFLGAVRGKA